MLFFSCNALKCVPMNNQECTIRPRIVNVNSNEPSFYPYRCQELMKQDIQNDIRLLNADVDQIQMFVTINNVGIKISVDENVRN